MCVVMLKKKSSKFLVRWLVSLGYSWWALHLFPCYTKQQLGKILHAKSVVSHFEMEHKYTKNLIFVCASCVIAFLELILFTKRMVVHFHGCNSQCVSNFSSFTKLVITFPFTLYGFNPLVHELHDGYIPPITYDTNLVQSTPLYSLDKSNH